MIKEILINFLINNFDNELRHNHIDAILESITKDYSYANEFSKLISTYSSIRSLQTLIYILFKNEFNIDILDKLIDNNTLTITFSKLSFDLAEELTDWRRIFIDIENKNINNNIIISSEDNCSKRDLCVVRFSDDISKFPTNHSISLSNRIETSIILPENLSGLFSLSYFKWLNDNCKLYFIPVMRDGELATKFDILAIMKNEYLKYLRSEVLASSEILEEDNKSLIEMFKDKFYKYSGLDRNNRITQENINDERLRALGRISIESGYSVDYIEESLLK